VDFFSATKPHLSGVKTYQPGKPIEEVEREYGLKDAIKMASNENALGPSPKALRAIKKNLGKLHRYPDGGCFYLRKKLSELLNVAPESLVFGNGSDELLIFAARAFAGKGDQVIIADPTFLIYEIASQVEGAEVVKVPIHNFQYDLDMMRSHINAKTRMIFIANPDNPVGTYVNDERLRYFLKDVPPRVIVVLDEAYFEYACAHKDYPNGMQFLHQYPNLIVTRTFSKAYGLAGLRVGYAVADVKIANALNKVREPFNVNLAAQIGAAAALDDTAHLKKTLRVTEEGRRYLASELKKLGLRTVDTATNFMLVDLRVEAQPVYEQLLKRGVIVRPMGLWGLKTFLRVTIGRPSENKRFIETLKKSV